MILGKGLCDTLLVVVYGVSPEYQPPLYQCRAEGTFKTASIKDDD